MQIVPKSRTGRLCEAAPAELQYFLVDQKGVAYHEPIACKDYMTDVGWTETTGKPSTVYGFAWKAGTISLADAVQRMALKHTSKKFNENNAASLQEFLRGIEAPQSFNGSVVEMCDPYLAVTFDTRWFARPYLISALTQYMRIGLHYDNRGILEHLDRVIAEGNPYCSYDGPNKMRVVRTNTALMLEGRVFPQTYEDYEHAIRAHDGGGLINISKKYLTA